MPVLQTIEIIASAVEENPDLCPSKPPLLRDFLNMCTINVQFLFNDIYYRQADGVAMGSPLGCLFADVFMDHLEEKLRSCIDSHCSFYARYIDDTFALIRDEKKCSRSSDFFQ